MSKNLDEIKKPVQKELITFEKHFRDSMKSSVPLLDKITYYIVQKKGKQVRPILVFLSARIFGPINDSTNIAASLIELLHTATLVHDDVVDDAYMRRGFFSINALWKNKIAVLVGDFLLSKGLLIALESHNYGHLQTLSRAVKQMSEGELLQLEKARKLDIDEPVYFDIITKKTATLIAASCCAGASSTSDDPNMPQKMWEIGEKIGIAFQIKDDLFDFGDDDIGKPRGIDIKEKKMTLPLIYALQQATDYEKKHIIKIIKNDSNNEKKVKEVIQFVKDKGGLQYAQTKMIQYQNEALALVNNLPDNEARQSLIDLLFYFTSRKN